MQSPAARTKIRLAMVISHPIQYYVPLYRRLAAREDIKVRIFFTWHAGQAPVRDRGFGQPLAWDIPLTDGYEYELVPNVSSDPGTHHFFGLRNPTLVERILAWHPDAVHVTGWAWESHLRAMHALARRGVPTLFRGDSHLLDSPRSGARWWFKQAFLTRVFSWPTAFLYAGAANRSYYEAFGVQADRLYRCPHSIDVMRFAEPAEPFEKEAAEWRHSIKIADDQIVLLFAGKFERKKRPLELMRAVQALEDSGIVLVLVGAGELENEVNNLAVTTPQCFRVLPFQNQSRMPLVYRLGDIFMLPSAFGETWGLAVNEALACGRPVLISDRVGCAVDVVDKSCGRVLPWADIRGMVRVANAMAADRNQLLALRRAATQRAWAFDVARTEDSLMDCLRRVCTQ